MAPQRREVTVYLLVGVLTTGVNIMSFNLFLFLHVDYRIANLFALLLAKLFAFIVNKVFVFQSKATGIKDLSKEFAGFFMGRIFTGLLDYFGLILLVEVFSLPQKGSKYALQAIVIVLNYILGKAAFTASAKNRP